MVRVKFKVGDKVRILPSAIQVSVAKAEVGKTGVIENYRSARSISVFMDNPCKGHDWTYSWNVSSDDIAPAIVVGRQLEFAFMEREVNYE